MSQKPKKKCYWCNRKAEYSAIFNFGKLWACEEHSFRFALVAHLQPDPIGDKIIVDTLRNGFSTHYVKET